MQKIFKERRGAFFEAMQARGGGDAVAVLFSAPVATRNNDVEHEYRQDSDFFYLTGFTEPESVVVLSTRGRKMTLFVRPRDPEREVWDGPRAGVDGAKERFGADEAFPVADFDAKLAGLLADHRRLFYLVGRNRTQDDKVLSVIERGRARTRFATFYPSEIHDPSSVVHEQRLFKGDIELDAMRRAAKITGEAHVRAMAAARPGMYEFELEAMLLETFRRHGSERVAYGSIVGSGPNATVLHYRANDRRIEDGDLVLIDAGCELDYYASDVTRTFPANGKFTREQRAIYDLVLAAQLASIEKTVVGATLEEIHAVGVEIIVDGLLRLGLLHGTRESIVKDESYKAFFMHRTSHWLGMDVHDVGPYFVDGRSRPLAEGMVLTVEPGIYLGANDARVPLPYRGIGVRIEDDILVTKAGPVNLTAAIPKSADEVERACAHG